MSNAAAFRCADPVQWREIAFCLSQLPMSDRSVRGLVDNLRSYKHTLADGAVCATFKALAAKIRKSGLGKGDMKEGIAEWERQILAAAGQTVGDLDEDLAALGLDDNAAQADGGMQAVEVA